MKRIPFISLLFLFSTSFGQSVKLSCFDKEKKELSFKDPIIIRTCFLKKLKFVSMSYPDDAGRYFDSEHKVYILTNKKYIRTSNAKVFNKDQNELLAIINSRIQEDFKYYSTDPKTKDCMGALDSIPTYKMNDFEISFNGAEIWFEVHWGLNMACRSVDGTIISFKVTEIEKYLN